MIFHLRKVIIKWTLCVVLVIIAFENLSAQINPDFALYRVNSMMYNPAFAGETDRFRLVGLQRNQWSGIADRPVSTSFSVNSPFNYGRLALGVRYFQTARGSSDYSGIRGIFSYKIRVQHGLWSFGLDAGVNRLKQDFESLNIKDPNDVVASPEASWEPEVGFGTLYTRKSWFVGFSAPNILSNWSSGSDMTSIQRPAHWYFMAGLRHELNNSWHLIAMNWTRWLEGGGLSADFTLTVNHKAGLWAGASIQSVGGVSVLAGAHLKELINRLNADLSLAYAYTAGFGLLGSVHSGSHEIAVSYQFKPRPKLSTLNNRQKILSPIFIQ